MEVRKALSKAKIRVAIASTLSVSSAALAHAIGSEPGFQVVCSISSDTNPSELAQVPDILLVELDSQRREIFQLMENLRRKFTGVRIVILLRHPDDIALRMFLAAGAHGFVLKTVNTELLLQAMYAVHNGYRYLDPNLSDVIISLIEADAAAGRTVTLTPREHQVLARIAAGQTYKQIASELTVSVKTVETYRTRIGEKLQLHTRKALVEHARSRGILS